VRGVCKEKDELNNEALMIASIEHGAVRELHINRPPANALSPELIVELKKNIQACATKSGAVVLSGVPGMFSAGLDVPLLLTLNRPKMNEVWREFYALLGSLACSPIPIAAAITGHAPAGGTVLPLFCDFRCMAEGNWKMGFTEVQVGLPLPPVIVAALKRQLGARQAERLAAGGVLLSPAEALNIGLIDEVVAAEKVVPRAVEWCENMLKLPSKAMSETRAKARADMPALFESLDSEMDAVAASWWSEEAQRTLRAVAERLAKKKP
jgi:Delta3-Delta2-enoyl-CoA isomerase